jgi:FAD/FMN-containing dehydrogenases
LLLKKAIELGGTPTAEHGIGKKKYVENGKEKPIIDLIYDKETIRQLISIKKSIDPNLILNIGNIIPEEYYLKFIS